MAFYLYYQDFTLAGKSTILESTSKISKYGATIKEATPKVSQDGAEPTEQRPRVNGRTVRPITPKYKQEQLEHYREGTALMVHLHPKHHGGTSFCNIIGKSGGPVPRRSCWKDKDQIGDPRYFPLDLAKFFATTPVPNDETGPYLREMRSHYHMVSWEYDGVPEMQRNLSVSDWEHPQLVSVAITRDPISRLLAMDAPTLRAYPGYRMGNLSHAVWWDFASNPKRFQTDNFFLRVLTGTKRAKYKKSNREYNYTENNLPTLDALRGDFDITEEQYKQAVQMLNRFTVVLDIACLDDGLTALARLLGLEMKIVNKKLEKSANERAKKAAKTTHQLDKNSTLERIGYDDVYEYLLEKNKFDIQLYEYSKSISLVDCNS